MILWPVSSNSLSSLYQDLGVGVILFPQCNPAASLYEGLRNFLLALGENQCLQ